jgi:hypothetical protein
MMSEIADGGGDRMRTLSTPELPPFEVKRWTLEDYHNLIRDGYLGEDDDVELLEGWIILKMPRGTDHDLAIEDADDLLSAVLPGGWKVRIQSALTIAAAESEPEPDLVVCIPQSRRRGRHPEPADTALIIEVADSSLERDRTVKQRIFAATSLPVYWIVNIPDRIIEVYTDPSGPTRNPRYRRRRNYRNGATVPVIIGGTEVGRIPASSLLPAE